MAKLDNLNPDRLASNPRATERGWLRYSSVILAAFRQHPRPYFYAPANTKPVSTCSKIRDAIRGAIAFGYADDSVSRDDLIAWWAEVVITHTTSTIRIGPPTKDCIQVEQATACSSSSNGLYFETLSFEEVCAFTLLLGNGRLSGPIRVRIPPDMSLLTDRLNVEIVMRDDGSALFL